MESLFRCPLCEKPLRREEGAYRCPSGHSFDIAREGYTHLLPANRKHSTARGDDREMAAARRDFLSRGYYEPLLNTLCSEIVPRCGETPALLDSGCGEGYYTAGIYQALRAAGKQPRMAGIDISKFILRSAAKREKNNFDDSLQEPILGISKISSIARQSKLVAVTFNTKLIQNIFEHCQTRFRHSHPMRLQTA